MTAPHLPITSLPAPRLERLVASGKMIGVSILGSTGSIGRQTLDVVACHATRYRVVALAAGSNLTVLREQIKTFAPSLVSVENANDATQLQREHPGLAIHHGNEGLLACATHPDADILVTATNGHAAMLPTARAIELGKVIALANKETIVCAGEIIIPLARRHGVPIRPVDSEHSAIWQAIGQRGIGDIDRLVLTASGGPFRTTPLADLATVTAAQALNHPTWKMGGKITVDSASMMNKGLEVIEAHWLFDIVFDRIEVVVHPESIIHSLVDFADCSQIAQLSHPDMRLPIQYALTWPDHLVGPCRRLSLAEVGTLRFEAADEGRFPALQLAREAGSTGSTYPTVLSAADEIAVEAFMVGRITFRGITDVVSACLDRHQPASTVTWDAIAEADAWARRTASELIND